MNQTRAKIAEARDAIDRCKYAEALYALTDLVESTLPPSEPVEQPVEYEALAYAMYRAHNSADGSGVMSLEGFRKWYGYGLWLAAAKAAAEYLLKDFTSEDRAAYYKLTGAPVDCALKVLRSRAKRGG